jgi:choline dehydrogenase-like flavoprotein
VQGHETPAERRLRWLLVFHAVLSAALAINYLFDGETRTVYTVPNSFAKDALFVAISVIGAADVRRRGWTALLLAGAYVALVAGEALTLAMGGSQPTALPLLGDVEPTVFLIGWMAIDVVFALWFVAWWTSAVKSAQRLRYLHPIGFHALASLAEVLIEGRREAVPPAQVARNVDEYLADLRARSKGLVQLALIALSLWPLLTARPPLPALSPESRKRFLERRFVEDVAFRRGWRLVRWVRQIMIRTASQMAYLGYYGDRDSWESIGYRPFAGRHGGRAPVPADQPEPVLKSLAVLPRQAAYDIVIVGSGAAGGILAHRFAAAGRSVLVLERGPHADPQRFTDDEVGQYLRLYNEGALELATNFSLQVLQGMCVGGGTTVNNALCLDPPPEVLNDWAARGVDPDALTASIEEVKYWLRVEEIAERTTTVAAGRFKQAVEDLRLPGRFEVMKANLSGACVACGYCNIGCAYGARLATLDFVLPRAQQDFPGPVHVLAEAEVERIVMQNGRAVRVSGTCASGEPVSVAAEKIVVAAGAIGSSWLLQRSRLGGDAVGEGLHLNINSPLTADFEDEIDSFAGIQMSHAYSAGEGIPDYLVETWFNPPATQALAMPGWFGQHFRNMRRYRHMACAGVLVGTTTPGRVKPGQDAPQIVYEPSVEDRDRVVEGLQTAGRIWLKAGATRVMPATFAYQEYRTPSSLAALPGRIRETGDLLLTSAHPQGGNAIGAVVDENFKVTGTENLYVCDASVFPTSVYVNPQLTVMGMAHYAAPRILA